MGKGVIATDEMERERGRVREGEKEREKGWKIEGKE